MAATPSDNRLFQLARVVDAVQLKEFDAVLHTAV